MVAGSSAIAAFMFGRDGVAPAAGRAPKPAFAVALVSTMIAVQVFCVVKPSLGLSKRFAWQMFSEALVIRIDTQVMSAGRYRSASFPGADTRWRTDGRRYHWTSWSEEQIDLAGYARWLARAFEVRDVRIVARYSINGGAEQQASFAAHNADAPAL